jgi:hypothetical protein
MGHTSFWRHRRAVAILAVALVALGAAGCRPFKAPPPGSGSSVMGRSSFPAAYLVAWYRAAAPPNHPYMVTVNIETLAQYFVEEGADENVRGDIAFAQSLVETNWFSYGGQVQWWQNNFAGIGACDTCSGGKVFPDARTGVRAQIQHLRNYADPSSRSWNLAHPPVREMYSTNASYNNFFKKGAAPDWHQMGNGNWATSPTYAATVLGVYNRIRSWAGFPPV